MTLAVDEMNFGELKPLYVEYQGDLSIITDETLEVFEGKQQETIKHDEKINLAFYRKQQIYCASSNVFHVIIDGKVMYSREFDEEILEIYSSANGTVVRTANEVFVKNSSQEYLLNMPLSEIIASEEHLYGKCAGKLILLKKVPEIVMDCPVDNVYYDEFLIGINKHKRLAIYDKSGCRGYLKENVKVKCFKVINKGMVVCFTKDERIIFIGLKLEYESIKMEIIGNISSPVWMEGSSQEEFNAKMFLSDQGISILRGSSVLLVKEQAILNAVSKEEESDYEHEYQIAKLVMTEPVDCNDFQIEKSLSNTYEIINGVHPFGNEIKDYKKLMIEFCEVYEKSLNEESGKEIDFNPFIVNMDKELKQIEQKFLDFVLCKIPEFSISNDYKNDIIYNYNRDLFKAFAQHFEDTDYLEKRKEEIESVREHAAEEFAKILKEAEEPTVRRRLLISDELCGKETEDTAFNTPASDPPKKIVKKVIVKKVVVKKPKPSEQETPEVEENEADVEPLEGKPKVRKIETINKVVIKKAPVKENEEPEEEDVENDILAEIEEQSKEPLVTYKTKEDEIKEQEEEELQSTEHSDTEVIEKQEKVKVINTISVEKPKEETADIKEKFVAGIENFAEQTEKFLQSAGTATIKAADGLADGTKEVREQIISFTKKAGQEVSELLQKSHPTYESTDYEKEVEEERLIIGQPEEEHFETSLFTSKCLLPVPPQVNKEYDITDDTVLQAARTDALAELETFNSFTRMNELHIYDDIYDELLKQILMFLPSRSVIEERFVILPTHNSENSFFLRAYDLRLHKEISCRILPHFMMFKSNQYFIQKLIHENILKILYIGEISAENGQYYSAIFVEKPYQYSLKDVLEYELGIIKSVDDVKIIVEELLNVISFLNSPAIKLMHRSLNPNEIFINEQLEIQVFHTGEIKSTDFDEYAFEETVFCAPEILCGVAAEQSDIWSVGVLTYRLLELAKGNEPRCLFETGTYGVTEAPPPTANGDTLSPKIANCCIAIENEVANAADFILFDGSTRGGICTMSERVEFAAKFGNRIEIMIATGKEPWDLEVRGVEKDTAIEDLDCPDEVKDFIRACWVFDYTKRLDAAMIEGMDWVKK